MRLKAKDDRPTHEAKHHAASAFVIERVSATMQTAAQAGLTEGKKEKRLSWRANLALVEAAAERSGLQGSDLLEYALAKVALEDDFAEKLQALTGAVGRSVDLEF